MVIVDQETVSPGIVTKVYDTGEFIGVTVMKHGHAPESMNKVRFSFNKEKGDVHNPVAYPAHLAEASYQEPQEEVEEEIEESEGE